MMSPSDGPATPRRVLVTGASSGIGAAAARLFASRGAEVWITYNHNASGVERTVSECEGSGAAVIASRLDLRSPASIRALMDELGERWGSLDAVVNNGAVCPYTPAEQISLEEWDEVLETNARGTFLMIRASLPLLRAATGDRAIVNVSSIAGQIGGVTTSVHYAASKAAILAITRSYARLLAPDRIRVNAVSPGPTTSEITTALAEDARAGLEKTVPLGRFGTADESAHAIVLLASPESSFTTGATYDVNGGLRID